MENNLPDSTEKAAWQQNASETGLRLLFVVLFAAVFYVSMILVVALVVFQLGHQFIIGNPNLKLQKFSKDLTTYLHRVLDYLTFNSELKPFPFDEWPSGD